jgi:hypothetical protein
LAIVKEIADLHSATIKIEQVSTLNGGLRILLDFGTG